MKLIATRAAVAAALATSLFTPVASEAHGIYFAQRAKQLALIYGVGADDLDAVKRLPLVENVAGFDGDWKPVPTQLRVAGPLLLVDSEAQPLAVTAVLFNGIWSKTPDGEWVKKGRDEVPNSTLSEKNYKFAVHLTGPVTTPVPPLAGQTLQIVPVTKIPDKMDQPLKLRVLFQGKPAAGATVLRDFINDPDAKPLKTGKDGTVTIKVRNQGLNVIQSVFAGPSDEPTKADRMEYTATLSFVLPHAPE
jgi:hypothetical protein